MSATLWGNWGRCGLARLARGVGGREWSCASRGRPGVFWTTWRARESWPGPGRGHRLFEWARL